MGQPIVAVVGRFVSALGAASCMAGLLVSPPYASASAEMHSTSPLSAEPQVDILADTHAGNDIAGRGGTPRSRTDYAALATQLAAQLADESFTTRLAAVTRALAAGGLPVTDGEKVVTPAVTPVGKLSLLVSERADIALTADRGGITASQMAEFLKAGGVVTKVGSESTIFADALRAWIVAARRAPTKATSFAPLLIREGVLRRQGIDLGHEGVALSEVALSALEVLLFTGGLDRAIPASGRKPAGGSSSKATAAWPRDSDPLAPNPQACGDGLRVWLRQVSPLLEQGTQAGVGKLAGDAFSKLLAVVNTSLGPIGTLSPKDLKAWLKANEAAVSKATDAMSRALAVSGALVKIQRMALLYQSATIYVDTPAGEAVEAPVSVPGTESSSFAPFVAVVGLEPEAAAAYEAASSGMGRTLLDARRLMTDCADVIGVQLPTLQMDTGEDLENFRIKWELQTNKHVQWDVNRWFAGKSYPAKTDWYVAPPQGVGKLKKIDAGQAAHVMYARIPAQDDYRLRPSLYEERTAHAVATARLDFSQPPNFKMFADTAVNSLAWAPIGLLGTFTDLAVGMYESAVLPEASAIITVKYMAPRCTGMAGRMWTLVDEEVCQDWRLSVGVVGDGLVTSLPAGIRCGVDYVTSPDPINPEPSPDPGPGPAPDPGPPPFDPGGPSITGHQERATSPSPAPDCEAAFAVGDPVILIATPMEGYEFDSWQGTGSAQCQRGVSQCTLTSDADLTLEAVFIRADDPGISLTMTGSGRVASSPSGLDCTASCTADFDDGEVVTLTATPSQGFAFEAWKGSAAAGCAPRVTRCVVTINSRSMIEAVFVEEAATKLAVSVTGGGMVTSSNFHIYCGSSFDLCQASTPIQGEVVVLTAKPDDGFGFTEWSGDCTGTSTRCAITIGSSMKSVMATFTPRASIYQRVTESASGVGANGESSCPSMTADGTKLAFVSSATNLVPNSAGGGMFVKDLTTGAVTRVVAGENKEFPGTPLWFESWTCPQISPDGRWVSFSMMDQTHHHLTTGHVQTLSGWVKNLETGVRTRLPNPAPSQFGKKEAMSFPGEFNADSSAIHYRVTTRLCGLEADGATVTRCDNIYRLDLSSLSAQPLDVGSATTTCDSTPPTYGLGPYLHGSLGGGRYLLMYHPCAADGRAHVIFDTVTGTRQSLDPPSRTDGINFQTNAASRFSTVLPLDHTVYSPRTTTGRFFDVVRGRYVLDLPNVYAQGLGLAGQRLIYAKCEGNLGPATCGHTRIRSLPAGADRILTSAPRFGGSQTEGSIPRIVGASADGTILIIQSTRDDLVAGDTNETRDIFLVRVDDLE